jgi:trk system potassium uptake protein
MYIIIAGGGKVGYFLAQELIAGHHEVLIVEREPGRSAAIAEDLGDNVLAGDGCEVTTMDAAGVARADLVAAVTGDDEDNLVICEIARYRGVTRTIARINNPRNELLFKRRGIETTVSATQAILAQIEQELPMAEMIPLMQMHKTGLELVEVTLVENSPVIGSQVKDVPLPPESLISLVVNEGGLPQIPEPDTKLAPGDALVIVTRPENVMRLRETFIGASHGMDT